jgi:ankyrin repeat protein
MIPTILLKIGFSKAVIRLKSFSKLFVSVRSRKESHRNTPCLKIHESLPLELIYEISKYISVKDYYHLRGANKTLSNLAAIAMLDSNEYIKTTQSYGIKFFAQGIHMINLKLLSLNDEVLLFMASNNHAFQFMRCINSKQSNLVSKFTKQTCLDKIIKLNLDHGMVIALLQNNDVNADCPVSFMFGATLLQNGTILQWACLHGHSKLVDLLLSDGSVDISARSSIGWSAIHFAAYNGQIDIFKAVVVAGTIDLNSPDTQGLVPIQYISSI